MSPWMWALGLGGIACAAIVIWLLATQRDSGPAMEARLRLLAASGSLIAEASTGGKVGWRYANQLDFQVAVYPGGLALDGFGWGLHVILGSEIRRVHWKRRLVFSVLAIDHQGVDCASPVSIRTGRDSDLANAIFQVANQSKLSSVQPEGAKT